MPISKDEFDEGRILGDLEKRIISFLGKNRDKAFTEYEIMDGINFRALVGVLMVIFSRGTITFHSIIYNLFLEGKIRMNIIQGQYYYMAK